MKEVVVENVVVEYVVVENVVVEYVVVENVVVDCCGWEGISAG